MIPKPKKLKTSLRWTVVLDGAVRKYPDGREICLLALRSGRNEYHRRMDAMIERQAGLCCIGEHPIMNPTFEHSQGRGMGAKHRDDRIVDEAGNPMNGAACWACNGAKGSKRA